MTWLVLIIVLTAYCWYGLKSEKKFLENERRELERFDRFGIQSRRHDCH